MSKNHYKIELIATDQTKKHEYQIKTVSYSNLTTLQSYKVMKFPSFIGGFTIPFSLKQRPDKVKFQGIITEIYKCLTIDDLQTMKIN